MRNVTYKACEFGHRASGGLRPEVHNNDDDSSTTAWLDLENRAPAACASPLLPSCAPTAQDPQGITAAHVQAHELTVAQVDIRDP